MNKEHNFELFNNMKMAFPVYEFQPINSRK